MRLIYGFGIRVLYVLMWIASFFNPKAKKWISGRKENLDPGLIPANREVYWFHCASLGEFDQGLPVMNAFKEKNPQIFLIVTFFSPSGMEFYNKRDHKVDLAVYLPIDTKRKAERFVQTIRPSKVFFVKYEFWYNHLKASRRSGAKVYGVSSLFRPTHRFFKWYGGFFRDALRLFDHFFVQDQRSADLLKTIGISNVQLTGDTRYDRMLAVKEKQVSNGIIEQFVKDELVLLLGSSWTVDEETFFQAIVEASKTMKVIIAPHDISEAHVEGISKLFNNEVIRYTRFNDSSGRILILDTIGQLTSAYRYASVAYVGGGFTGKLHNILEPGAFGVPVLIGPKFERFPEAQLFTEMGVAKVVNTPGEFTQALHDSLKNKMEIGAELAAIFRSNSGAAQKIVNAVGAEGK
jgi:3-deoxy-D-manno-octulosonic-acid transferase